MQPCIGGMDGRSPAVLAGPYDRTFVRGSLWQASELAGILICDINPWLPHRARFGWSYMATHTTLWLDMRDQFAEEHHTEWEAQKSLMHSLNDLEHNTKVIYRARLIKRQEDMEVADSREAAAKQLLPE